MEGVFESILVLPVDLRVARTHALIRARLAAAGEMVGSHDMLIAATAITHGYAVLTDNPRDFGRIPGLVIRQPRWPNGLDQHSN